MNLRCWQAGEILNYAQDPGEFIFLFWAISPHSALSAPALSWDCSKADSLPRCLVGALHYQNLSWIPHPQCIEQDKWESSPAPFSWRSLQVQGKFGLCQMHKKSCRSPPALQMNLDVQTWGFGMCPLGLKRWQSKKWPNGTQINIFQVVSWFIWRWLG